MPNIRMITEVSPTCASAGPCCVSCGVWPLETTSPLMPATTISGAAPSTSQGLRIVRSFRNSAAIRAGMKVAFLNGLLLAGVGGGRAGRDVRLADVRGQPQEGILQAGGLLDPGARELAERAGEAQPAGADDDDAVHRLGDLAQDVAGDQHSASLSRQLTQQQAHGRLAQLAEPVGSLAEDQRLRIPEQGCGQAETLA